jgi:phospholipase/carboxylesterase
MKVHRSLVAGLLLVALAGEGASASLPEQMKQLPKGGGWLWLPARYERSDQVYGLVVVLHPAGIGGQRFLKVWGIVAEQTDEFIVLAPEASDLKKRMWSLKDEPRVIDTVKQVASSYRIDPHRVLLTGFSQGGIYTFTFGLRNPHVFRGLAPVSGALVARPNPTSAAILERARGLAIYICHGALDDRIPVARARAARDRLEELGYRVTYREERYQGHTYPKYESQRIWRWFRAVTASPANKTQK